MGYLKWQNIRNAAIGGFITVSLLVAGLLNLAGVSYSDSGDVVCTDCFSEIVVNSSFWEVRVTFAGADEDVIFKKRTRSRTLWVNLDKVTEFVETSPQVPVEILVPAISRTASLKHDEYGFLRPLKEGDTLIHRNSASRSSPSRIIIHGTKGKSQVVKWGFELEHFLMQDIEIDPVWGGDGSGITNQSNEGIFTNMITSGPLHVITKPQLAAFNTNFSWNGSAFVLTWDDGNMSKEFGYRVFALTNISGNEVRRYIPEDTQACARFGWNKSLASLGEWKHAFWIENWKNTAGCQAAKNNLEYVGLDFFWENVTPVLNHSARQVVLDEVIYDYNDIPLSGLNVVRNGRVVEIHNVKALQRILIDPSIVAAGISTTDTRNGYPLARTSDNIYHTVYRDGSDSLAYARSLDYGLTWTTQVLDSTQQALSMTIITNSTDGLWVIYATTTQDDVKVTTSDDGGITWSAPIILPDFDGDGTHEFPEISAVMDASDQVHVCIVVGDWAGISNDWLMYTNHTSTGWSGQVNVSIDSTDDTDTCDIDVDSNNLPYIVATGTDGDDMEIWNAGNWGDGNEVTIDLSNANDDPRIYIDPNDVIHTAWDKDSGNIGYANSTTGHATVWTVIEVQGAESSDEPSMTSTTADKIVIIYEGATSGRSVLLSNSTNGGVTWFNQTLNLNDTLDGIENPIQRRSHQPYDLTRYRLDYTYRNTSGTDSYGFDTYVLEPTTVIGFEPPTAADQTAQDDNFTQPSFSVNISGTLENVTIDWNGTNITLFDSDILVANWHFNNNTADESGNGNDQSSKDSGVNCSTNVVGRFQGACDFDGTDNAEIQYGAPTSLQFGDDQNPITFQAWVKLRVCQASGGKFIEKKETGGNVEIVLLCDGGTGVGEFEVRASGGTSGKASGTTDLQDNEWHQLTGVKTGNELEIFVDGVSEGTDTGSFSGQLDDGDWRIGGSVNGGDRFIDGFIDEVRIWKKALTSEEINITYRTEMGRFFMNVTDNVNDSYDYAGYVRDSDGVLNSTGQRTVCIGVNFAGDCAGAPSVETNGTLRMVLNSASSFIVDQNSTGPSFNFSGHCEGGDTCHTVNLTVYFNFSGLQINDPIRVDVGGTPFYNFSGAVNFTCGRLNEGESCSINSTLNNTGAGNYSFTGNGTTNATTISQNGTGIWSFNVTPAAVSVACDCPSPAGQWNINSDECTLATTCDISGFHVVVTTGYLLVDSGGTLLCDKIWILSPLVAWVAKIGTGNIWCNQK